MTDKVVWMNQGHDFWDQTLLKDLLEDYAGDRQIFIVPGAIRGQIGVNRATEPWHKVTVIITSDEENKFPVDHVGFNYQDHPDIRVIVNYPNRDKHWNVDGYLPIGYAPKTRELVKKYGMGAKSLDWFFAGQITHDSRRKCAKALEGVPGGDLITTEGFAQGLDYEDYMQRMCRAKVVPCPAGNVNPDSFRLYEALEAGCIPIPENKAFWTMLFGEVPFPIVNDWSELPELIKHYKDRPDVNNKCSAWWQLKKRELKWKLQS